MAVQDGVVTGIWWDMNSCQYSLHMIHSLPLPIISHLLSRFGIPSPAYLSSATAYVCDSKVSPESELSIKNDGFHLSKLTPGEIQNLDKMLLTDLMLWAMENSPVANIVLLTGNIDSFAYALTKLHEIKFRIFVCNNNINQTSVPDYCHSYLLWPHFLLSLLQYTDNYTSLVFSNSPEGLAIRVIPKSNDNPNLKATNDDYGAERHEKENQMSNAISMKEFQTWFMGALHCKYRRENGYDISLLARDCKKSTGKNIDLELLGFSKISELVEQCSKRVVLREVKPGVHMAFPAQKEKRCDGRFKAKASSEEFNEFMHQMLADGYFTEGLPLDRLINLFGERAGGLLLDHVHLGFDKLSSLVRSWPLVCIKSRSGEKSGKVFVFPSDQGLQYCSEGCASKSNCTVMSSAKWGLIESITSLWKELINELEHDEVAKVESGSKDLN